ncbi:MAG: MFS transporter [Actinobacteria bacterium]|nr:MFS transporter [Actinomycetota bacterium]
MGVSADGTPDQRALLILISIVLALDAALYSALTPLLPAIQAETGASDGAAGFLVATYALGLLAASLPGGWLTARIGARTAMTLGLVLFAVAGAGFGLANSIVTLDVMRAIQGAAAALSWAAGFVWLLAAGPKDRHGLLIGSAISASVVGSLAGPVLGALAAQVGRAGVFVGLALFAAVIAVAINLLPAPSRSGDLRLIAALRTLATVPGAVGAWVVLLAGGLIGSAAVLAPLRLDALGVGSTAIAAVFLVIGLSEMVIGPVVGRFSDRLGPRLPILVSLALTAGVLFLLAVVDSVAGAIVGFVLLLPTVTASITPAFATLSRTAELRGVAVAGVLGAGNLAWACGEGAGAVSAGWLEGSGHAVVSYLAMAGAALATVAGLALVGDRSLGAGMEEPIPAHDQEVADCL